MQIDMHCISHHTLVIRWLYVIPVIQSRLVSHATLTINQIASGLLFVILHYLLIVVNWQNDSYIEFFFAKFNRQ